MYSFKKYKKHTLIYTIYGILFGFMFPIFSTIFDSWAKYNDFSPSSMLLVQKSNPLLWVIDSAPFWLGLFAFFIGAREDKVNQKVDELNDINNILKDEIVQRKKIEDNLRDLNEEFIEDLVSAKLIQESFLPEIPDFDPIILDYRYLPLKTVGGDFISIIKLREGGISILIGDVIGHGVTAALLTTLVKVLSNKTCRKYALYPKEYLEYLNNQVIRYLPENDYLTAIYGLITEHDGGVSFNYSRGAHPYPIYYNSKTKKASVFKSEGLPLGYDENITFLDTKIEMYSGDRLVLVTDGFVEVRNKEKRGLDFKGLIEIVEKACHNNLSVSDSLDSIISDVEDYRDGMPVSDDRIILCFEVK